MENNKRKKLIGRTKRAYNGMWMTIIADYGDENIDVQFEDGAIAYNKKYHAFQSGYVAHPSKKNREGEKNISTCGLEMTIVAYRACNDVDIEFEDGVVVCNKCYSSFQKGSIRHPNVSPYKRHTPLCDHTGETNIANNGMKMKIIAYRNFCDIDIQFEDGTVAENKRYDAFKLGKVKHPLKNREEIFKQRIGETGIANNGMKMTIIAYRNSKDIDVQFEDGEIVTNKLYGSFKEGAIGHPYISTAESKHKSKIGETGIANNGMKMTIIAYRNSKDIDVQFEDGEIITNKLYNSFKEGAIGHPYIHTSKSNCENRVGKTNIANNGMEMTIIVYRSSKDIDIRFKDGEVVTNKSYQSFKNGSISHPNENTAISLREKRMGETGIACNGMKMTIVAYRTCKDIDVKFEDGKVATNRSYYSFKNGSIRHPSVLAYKSHAFNDRTGETNVANNGMKMTIVAYRGFKDIDVEFEDGEIVTNRAYHSFKKGNIRHPNVSAYKSHAFNDRTGEIGIAKNGMKMTIVAYRGCNDIDVQFEDGEVVTNKSYQSFKQGCITHPKENSITSLCEKRVGETNTAKNGMKMTIVAYRGCNDIDVQFEDGEVVTNKSYQSFRNGCIGNPNTPKTNASFPEMAILYYLQPYGFKKMNQGYFCKFNQDFGYREIDIFNENIMFGIEYDGFYFHKTKEAWINDNNKDLLCENCTDIPITLLRVRENGLMPTKSSKTINIMRKKNNDITELENIIREIAYIISTKTNINCKLGVDIERDFDKIIKLKNIYSSPIMFHPHRKSNFNKTGETSINKHGLKMTVVAYRGSNDIDVEFEDGTVVCNKNYRCFKYGVIRHPSRYDRVGETNTNIHGLKMTVIAYRGCNNIDVEFEDGTVIYNRQYRAFKDGTLSHPSRYDRVGETNTNIHGLKMTVIAYRGWGDIDVEFEDGTIVYNRQYRAFRDGTLSHPSKYHKVGETIISNNGIKMTIVAYRGCDDVDILFEDGTIAYNKKYRCFKKGAIAHPLIPKNSKKYIANNKLKTTSKQEAILVAS